MKLQMTAHIHTIAPFAPESPSTDVMVTLAVHSAGAEAAFLVPKEVADTLVYGQKFDVVVSTVVTTPDIGSVGSTTPTPRDLPPTPFATDGFLSPNLGVLTDSTKLTITTTGEDPQSITIPDARTLPLGAEVIIESRDSTLVVEIVASDLPRRPRVLAKGTRMTATVETLGLPLGETALLSFDEKHQQWQVRSATCPQHWWRCVVEKLDNA
jgi:hypothetical protein